MRRAGRKWEQIDRYCSHYYRMGQFTDPNVTVEEMVATVQGILKKMHVPGFVAKKVHEGHPKPEAMEIGASFTLNRRLEPERFV